MSDAPVRLSIITPSYNHERFLQYCIDSVDAVAREHPALQHVIVDDASTDGSLELARAAGRRSSYRTVLAHDRNRGLSATLNTALEHASGGLVRWLNSADAYHPPGLLAALERVRDLPPRVGLVYGDVQLLVE